MDSRFHRLAIRSRCSTWEVLNRYTKVLLHTRGPPNANVVQRSDNWDADRCQRTARPDMNNCSLVEIAKLGAIRNGLGGMRCGCRKASHVVATLSGPRVSSTSRVRCSSTTSQQPHHHIDHRLEIHFTTMECILPKKTTLHRLPVTFMLLWLTTSTSPQRFRYSVALWGGEHQSMHRHYLSHLHNIVYFTLGNYTALLELCGMQDGGTRRIEPKKRVIHKNKWENDVSNMATKWRGPEEGQR